MMFQKADALRRAPIVFTKGLRIAAIGQPRATQRRCPQVGDDEAVLTTAIERLATQYGRYATGKPVEQNRSKSGKAKGST